MPTMGARRARAVSRRDRPPAADVPDPGRWTSRALGSALFVAAATAMFALALGRPVERTDEAWFLWVAHRVASGDTLYRDAYSVTTPLSHWVAALALAITGTRIATIRLLTVLCFVTSAELARRLVARAGLRARAQGVLLAALFVTAAPAAHFVALYSWLAVACAMGAWVVSTSPSFPSRARWLTVGALCGVSCSSKPNIGVAALVASIVVALTSSPTAHRRVRAVADAGAAFTVTVALVFAAVWLSGGWSAFVGQVILDKGAYVRSAVSYPGQLRDWLHVVWRRGLALEPPVRQGVVVLPLLALATILVALARARRARRDAVSALAFTAVGLVALVPRPTPTHMAAAAPFLLSGMVVTWSVVGAPKLGVRTCAVVGAVTVAAAVIVAGGAAVGMVTPRSRVAPFAGTPRPANEQQLQHELATIRRMTAGAVFIVRSDAGYLYLAGRLHDPTRFDVPERTDFGPNDQQTAIDAVRTHPPRFVCLTHRRHPAALEATALERYLRRHSTRVADAGVCQVRALTLGAAHRV